MVLGPYKTADLKRWVRLLRYFRICGSFGAHFDEPDSLRVALRFSTREEFESELRKLGAEVAPFRNEHTGVSSELMMIDGAIIYVTASPDHFLVLHFVGSQMRGWEPLTTELVRQAASWEKWIEPFASRIIDPPYFPELVVSRETRPNLWED